MIKEEFLVALKEKEEAIENINKEIAELKAQYCNDCAPYKIGDKIELYGKIGIISYIGVDSYNHDFKYKWRILKKDGSEGIVRDIWSYDTKSIKKVED